MLSMFFGNDNQMVMLFGVIAAFFATFILTNTLRVKLPSDQGRAFAVDGAKSAGKPRGAGIIFVLVFAVVTLLFANFSLELLIYVALTVVEMITGYMDDASSKPWGEYFKGFLDLVVAVMVAITYVHFNGTGVTIALTGYTFRLPLVVFVILVVILVWTAINVTNCSDGVDGLSASLVSVTLMSFYIVMEKSDFISHDFNYVIILFVMCLVAYLWFNATPSLLLMGDAGSRAMGIFIAITALKSGAPFLYLLLSLVLILDGGLGLLKVALLRFCKIHILKNTRTPLHDHVRKNIGWSNTQVVFRFVIIQIVLSAIVIYLI
ncbi:MAG: phospho-N-acetylmuramoyl-pentapeptide-transferase [Butyrivibrio sp.]|uniref:phospho-N-acetylmuramoyl-pentapeptide- transferase n=1 Tax=Butyrivibrio sp. TaxID=28121 RepID=UPI0025E01A74|nr:phospho-N-acetylmuramoyl-pentapeptide-transferase [Butyrivibrio sp.]MCR5769965.1 phospho-N-acetylmuramoyl-pentapeptide-transferase [Butyrivibrio sp.]